MFDAPDGDLSGPKPDDLEGVARDDVQGTRPIPQGIIKHAHHPVSEVRSASLERGAGDQRRVSVGHVAYDSRWAVWSGHQSDRWVSSATSSTVSPVCIRIRQTPSGSTCSQTRMGARADDSARPPWRVKVAIR